MSEHIQPGLHPDADALSAFVEGMLPEHERIECLAHLAECSRCREIVWITQEPPEAPVAPAPVPFWKRWAPQTPVFAGIAAAGVIILSVGIYRWDQTVVHTPNVIAESRAPETTSPEARKALAEPATPPSRLRRDAGVRLRRLQRAPQVPEAARLSASPELPSKATSLQLPAPRPKRPEPELRSGVSVQAAPAPVAVAPANSAGISGIVTDASGAVIDGATVSVRPVGGESTVTRTDATGKFAFSGLPPGRYQLQIEAPGFTRTLKDVDVEPQQMARADSVLSVGSVSETVAVEAGAPTPNFETAALSARKVLTLRKSSAPLDPADYKLPSKLTTVDSASKDKLVLASDSAGTVFISRNAGRSWKTVKAVWRGKVAHLSFSSDAFRLTTDDGAAWSSRDGAHWSADQK